LVNDDGHKSAVNVWNRRHPNKMMYVRCKIWDDTYKTILNKWYPLITSRMNSKAYSSDKADNCFIDKSNYKTWHRGHAICFMKWTKWSWQHCNTYPKHKCNVFWVKDIEALSDTWFYSKWVYAIIPEKNNEVEEAKKRKLVKLIMSLNSKLWKLSWVVTRNKLADMNDYFRSNWF